MHHILAAMAHAPLSRLIILDYLDRLHANRKTLQVPKSYLQMAFPLKGNQIDFTNAKETLSRFGFAMIGIRTSKSIYNFNSNFNSIVFKKKTDRIKLVQEKAA